MTPEDTIKAAFAGKDLLHHDVRIALLRVLHVGQTAELWLENSAAWLTEVLEDPPYSLGSGPDSVTLLAWELRFLASQLEQAASALNAAKPHWQQFETPREESPDAIGIRPDRASTRDSYTAETPF